MKLSTKQILIVVALLIVATFGRSCYTNWTWSVTLDWKNAKAVEADRVEIYGTRTDFLLDHYPIKCRVSQEWVTAASTSYRIDVPARNCVDIQP